MDVAKLGQRQLFGMKKDNLIKRIVQRFEQTIDSAEMVEYLVVLLLRDALCVGDFALKELTTLIQQIFLTKEPNDTLRKQCVFFQPFFSDEQWRIVMGRLFTHKADFQEFTEDTRFYRTFLEKKQLEQPESSTFQYNIVSIFKDASGKRHTWTLRDAKEITKGLESETAEVLKILTTLSIFQHADVRRFAEYLTYKSIEARVSAEHAALQEEPKEPTQVSSPTETASVKAEQSKSPATEAVQRQSSAASANKQAYPDEVAARADTVFPLPGETPQRDSSLSTISSSSKDSKKNAC